MSSSAQAAAAEVLAADDARYAAMIALDFAALGRLLADDMLYTHSSAVTDTKAEYLAALRSGKYRYRGARREGATVRIHGDVAIVNGRSAIDVDVDGAPRSLRNAFTNVWIRTPAGWRMTAWQSTNLPQG